MKTLLVRLPDFPTDGAKRVVTPPIGLWSIRENCPDVEVLDLNVSPIKPLDADILGLSLHFPSQERFLPVVRALIPLSQKTVYGGPHGGLMYRNQGLSHYGDGESYFEGKPVDFASLRMPSFTEEEIERYWKYKAPFGQTETSRWLPIETSRGCTHGCHFCAMPKFWQGWKARPVEVIDDYLSWCDRRRDIQELIILDDNISLEKDRFIHLMEVFARYGMTWSAPNGIYARTLLDEEVLDALSKSTCMGLSLALETGSTKTAGLMNLGKKYLQHHEASYLVRRLKAMTIHLTGFFIIGYPGEDEWDVKKTLAFANSLPLDERYIYFATPYEGTRLGDAIGVSATTYKQPAIATEHLSRDRLLELWQADHDYALQRRKT
jgi:hypothetical protein